MTMRGGKTWVGAQMRSFEGLYARWASSAGESTARSNAAGRPAISGLLSTLWRRWQTRRQQQLRAGRLRVTETVSMGEKRFVAVVEVDGRRLLVGGGSAGVSLLTRLEPASLETASSGLKPVQAGSAIQSGNDLAARERHAAFAPAAFADEAFAPVAFAEVLRQSAEAAR